MSGSNCLSVTFAPSMTYDPRFSRVFETEPSPGDGDRGIAWPRGRIVGGSSSINGLIYIRGQHEDFDDWQKCSAKGWSHDQVLPHFKAIDRYDRGDDRYHGRSGERMQRRGMLSHQRENRIDELKVFGAVGSKDVFVRPCQRQSAVRSRP